MRRPPDRFSCPDRRSLLTGAAALGLSATVAACGSSEPATDQNGRVRLRLAVSEPSGAELGGFYQALATGLYEARGLNVQLIRPGFGQDVPRALASGNAELGLADDSFTPLRLVAEGAPVKAVAAFFQQSPQALVRHAASVGNRVPASTGPIQVAGAQRETVWPWLKARLGYTDSQLADPDLEAFRTDPRLTLLGHIAREAIELGESGTPALDVRLLAEEGYASYGAVVLAPTAFARDNEDALRAFIAASIEGWADYIAGDPDLAHALIRRANRDQSPSRLDGARDALREAGIVTGGGLATGIGAMSVDRWQAFFEGAVEAGVAPSGLDWRQAFTTDYLSPAAAADPSA